jgi:hypothetical protein
VEKGSNKEREERAIIRRIPFKVTVNRPNNKQTNKQTAKKSKQTNSKKKQTNKQQLPQTTIYRRSG